MSLFNKTNEKLCPFMLNMVAYPPTPKERKEKPVSSALNIASAICFESDCAWWIPEANACSVKHITLMINVLRNSIEQMEGS